MINIKTISSIEVCHLIKRNEDYIVLDVRSYEERKLTYIDNSILIPINEIFDRVEIDIPNKEMIILVYCEKGVRSKIAAFFLLELGYTCVFDFGGILNWPFEIVTL